MAIATSSSDNKRLNAETGVKMPKITSGMTKLPPAPTKPADDKRKQDSDKKQSKKDADAQAAKDAKLIDGAKKRFKSVMSIEASNRTEGMEDLKFLNGQQWSEADATSRAAEGRPCITENRLPTFANQITNDQRQNRPAINISPLGDRSSKKDAKLLKGMIRAIERDSMADVAYDTGFASAVHNGWGYWRVLTEYESETSFNKVIVIKSIPNPMNVYLDPARTPFMLDAKWGFISEMLPREEFTREYPDASVTPWNEAGVGDNDKDWITPEAVRVSEYYWFEHEERELIMLDNGHQGWEDELDEDIAAQVAAGKLEVLARRTVQEMKLKWCKMTAIEVLERRDCDGSYIPIIECDGTVLNINGKVVKKGIVRDAKGPQRMANYYSTLEAEHVALQPKAPWIMEEGQIEGHEGRWQNANKKSYSYLLYKSVNVNGKPAPPPQRQAFAGPPEAVLAAKQGTIEALKGVTGIRFDATMSERMQDESGRAIRELNNNANLGAYHYIDNFARALKNTGTVLVDLIPNVYDTKRVVAILDETGAEDKVEINPHMQQPHGEKASPTPTNPNQRMKMFNPKVGRYQVTSTIGPSYATRRTEAADSQMKFMAAVPAAAPLIMDLVAKNSDWEGSEQIANRLAKSVPPNFLTPDREDMTPQTQALIQGLQKQLQDNKIQMQQMAKQLDDHSKDRDVIRSQVETTYAAKHEKNLLDSKDKQDKIMADVQLKLAQLEAERKNNDQNLLAKFEEIAAKREATFQGTVGRQLAELVKHVQQANKPESAANSTGGDTPGKSSTE